MSTQEFKQLALPLCALENTSAIEESEKMAKTFAPNKSSNIEECFHKATRKEWRLLFVENRSVMISIKPASKPPTVRLQKIFLKAPPEFGQIIADVAERRKRKWPKAIGDFIRKNLAEAQSMKPRRMTNRTDDNQERRFDLQKLFDRLNEQYFHSSLSCRLEWMHPKACRPKSLHLGAYYDNQDLIRIHPVLDQKDAPAFVIEEVLFHEMTHAQIKSKVVNGRRISHGKDFKAKLAEYPMLTDAELWLQKNLPKILRRYYRKRY